LTRVIEELGMKNIANQQNADRAKDLAESLNELRKERDNLSSTVESLQLNPFMTDKGRGGSSIAV
jgi:archaellum component FlaC